MTANRSFIITNKEIFGSLQLNIVTFLYAIKDLLLLENLMYIFVQRWRQQEYHWLGDWLSVFVTLVMRKNVLPRDVRDNNLWTSSRLTISYYDIINPCLMEIKMRILVKCYNFLYELTLENTEVATKNDSPEKPATESTQDEEKGVRHYYTPKSFITSKMSFWLDERQCEYEKREKFSPHVKRQKLQITCYIYTKKCQSVKRRTTPQSEVFN